MNWPQIHRTRWLAWLLFGAYLFLAGGGRLFASLNQAFFGAPFTGGAGNLSLVGLLALTIWSVVGLLLATRQPGNLVGWLFLLVPVLNSLDNFAFGYAYYGTVTRPGSLPGVNLMVVWLYWTGRVVNVPFGTLLLLLFPTGRPLSRRWLSLAAISGGAALIFMATAAFGALQVYNPFPFRTDLLAAGDFDRAWLVPIWWAAFVLTIAPLPVSLLALFVRLRRSAGVERQQLKWFAYAASFVAPALSLLVVGRFGQAAGLGWMLTVGILIALLYQAGIALAAAVAILRYRLWDIDLIIQRTLVYGLLTLALAAIYFGSVVLLQQLFQGLTGEQSPLVVVLSTLAIAALFTPLRRRSQAIIDRRFYRRKYDAAQTLARFAAAARDEVDLGQLTAELLRVVDDTVQPAARWLWLRET